MIPTANFITVTITLLLCTVLPVAVLIAFALKN